MATGQGVWADGRGSTRGNLRCGTRGPQGSRPHGGLGSEKVGDAVGGWSLGQLTEGDVDEGEVERRLDVDELLKEVRAHLEQTRHGRLAVTCRVEHIWNLTLLYLLFVGM